MPRHNYDPVTTGNVTPKTPKGVKVALALFGLAALGIHLYWASMFWTLVFARIQMHLAWIIPLVVLAVVTVALAGLREALKSGPARPVLAAGAGLTALTFVVGIVGLPMFNSFNRANEYSNSVVTASEGDIDFKVRTPYPVAVRSSQNALGDLTGGEIDNVKYTSSDETSEYTFLVRSKDLFGGYKAVTDLNGQRCDFDEDVADRREGGWFAHNLHRLVNQKERNVFFSATDVYGYCDGETPFVVMPLKQVDGIFPALHVPAGVALYNGKTGELTIDTEVESGDIPGPVYPQSLAENSRNSLRASGTWWQYIRNLVGYGTTERDADDPNSGNISEYGLTNTDGQGAYVTPLVSNGGSTAITALGVQYYGTNIRGELNPYEVSRYENSQISNGQAASVIRATFDSLNWQNGMTIFEVTPTEGNKRVATLGLNQAIQYRVIFDSESYTLQDARGNEIRTENINESGETEGTQGQIAGVDISTLSDEDLIRLVAEAAAEQQRRLSDG